MAKKKKFMVLDHDGQHEYDVVVEETKKGKKFSLYHSNGEQWLEHAKGELQLSMLDHGDGIKFDRKLKNVGYDTLTEIRILMGIERHLDSNDMNKLPYQLVEKKSLIDL